MPAWPLPDNLGQTCLYHLLRSWCEIPAEQFDACYRADDRSSCSKPSSWHRWPDSELVLTLPATKQEASQLIPFHTGRALGCNGMCRLIQLNESFGKYIPLGFSSAASGPVTGFVNVAGYPGANSIRNEHHLDKIVFNKHLHADYNCMHLAHRLGTQCVRQITPIASRQHHFEG